MSDSGGESSEMEEEVREGFVRVDNMIRALSWSNDEHDADDRDHLDAVLDQVGAHRAWPWARPSRSPDSDTSDGEPEEFDIHLPTAHAYLASEVADEEEDASMAEVRGPPVFEEGWSGELMCFPHPLVVLPGEEVPLLIRDPAELSLYRTALDKDRAFCLLAEETLGVVCRVLEGGGRELLGVRARACGRVRAGAGRGPGRRTVTVLRDSTAGCRPQAGAPWPQWLYRYPARAVSELRARLSPGAPADVSALSWAAGGVLAPEARCELLRCGCAWTRAVLAARSGGRGWACGGCGLGVADQWDERPMSSHGVGAAYTNPGGVVHDVVTVSRVRGARTSGGAQAACSWFPGYRWRVLLCERCHTHLGWRYDATRKRLRPQRFYGLTRTNLAAAARSAPSSAPDTPTDSVR